MPDIITPVPDDALLFDVAQQAFAARAQIISNGKWFALSTTIPAGWHAVPVADKSHQLRSAA